ncbi:hypothetical protein KY284_029847 [Solanum tuberosum]|nr:hypothetical protein KY284_029847 [Solanum tuberosum]
MGKKLNSAKRGKGDVGVARVWVLQGSWTKFSCLQRDLRWDFVWRRSCSSLEEDAGTEVGYCWYVIVVLLLMYVG